VSDAVGRKRLLSGSSTAIEYTWQIKTPNTKCSLAGHVLHGGAGRLWHVQGRSIKYLLASASIIISAQGKWPKHIMSTNPWCCKDSQALGTAQFSSVSFEAKFGYHKKKRPRSQYPRYFSPLGIGWKLKPKNVFFFALESEGLWKERDGDNKVTTRQDKLILHTNST
jgi:hypothetical protein